ncbi:MAG: cell wall hydrolase [Sphingomonas sp.]|uniref:cell wall hydrolase n=1 Tax=Sphingomonas sp. TaxID=28214 RepID=UPI001AD3A4F4|nr:cell wall hydrolase [Sphingomonas sp.]MBN8809061.1 cell wall hydrolase [Sphingomonas sp.]
MHSLVRAVASAILSLVAIFGLAAPAAASDLPIHAVPALGATTQMTLAGGPAASTLVFSSLAAAVSAQVIPDASDKDLACLAGAVYFESHGEPLLGQLAVAKVILNRTRSGRYPTSICGVVTQRSQFSFVHGGAMPTAPANAHYRTALAIAQVALTNIWEDPSEGALSFHARRVSPGWAMKRVKTIGNHIFYR